MCLHLCVCLEVVACREGGEGTFALLLLFIPFPSLPVVLGSPCGLQKVACCRRRTRRRMWRRWRRRRREEEKAATARQKHTQNKENKPKKKYKNQVVRETCGQQTAMHLSRLFTHATERQRPSRTTRTTKPRVADIIATNQCCHPTKVALRYPVGSGERVGLCVELIGIGLTCQTTRAQKQRKQSVAVCRLVAVWLGCAIRAQIELMLHFRIPPYKTSLARNTQRLCRHP